MIGNLLLQTSTIDNLFIQYPNNTGTYLSAFEPSKNGTRPTRELKNSVPIKIVESHETEGEDARIERFGYRSNHTHVCEFPNLNPK